MQSHPERLDCQESEHREMWRTISDIQQNQVLLKNEFKHITAAVSELIENVKSLTKQVSSNSKVIDAIKITKETEDKKKESFRDTIKSQWWKIVGFILTVGTILVTNFEIVRQATAK